MQLSFKITCCNLHQHQLLFIEFFILFLKIIISVFELLDILLGGI